MEILFNNSQLERLSETLSNLGLLLYGSMVLPVLSGIDKIDPPRILLGLIIGSGFIILSLSLLKGVKK